jgi:N-acetyl-1-D-myo-inositol-2-amino-2-deoxy-alpha-D-glucopyranoside deacetylase
VRMRELRDTAGNPLRLLMVHAHPDDETTTTGATAARYAAEGVEVHLVTCTRGERGEILDDAVRAAVTDADPLVTAERLGGHRMGELAGASRHLGLAGGRFLAGPGHWWDSGMAGRPEGDHPRAFAGGDLGTQADQLVEVLRELRPQVVVTYDERGGYGHPDHVRAHDVTMAAVRGAADIGAWVPAKVYAAVVPRSTLRSAGAAIASAPALAGPNPFEGAVDLSDEQLATLPFGVPDEAVTARIDARRWLPAKVAAMREHRSQMHQNGWFFALADADGDLAVEHYRLLAGTASGAPEDDLFAGIRA